MTTVTTPLRNARDIRQYSAMVYLSMTPDGVALADPEARTVILASDHDALVSQLRARIDRSSPWIAAKDAPAGREGIVRVELEPGCWCYRFAEWRVSRGIEGWFDTDGHLLVRVTRWMPIPDDDLATADEKKGEG